MQNFGSPASTQTDLEYFLTIFQVNFKKFQNFSEKLLSELKKIQICVWCFLLQLAEHVSANFNSLASTQTNFNQNLSHLAFFKKIQKWFEIFLTPEFAQEISNKQEIPCTTEARSTFFECTGSNPRFLGFFIISLKFLSLSSTIMLYVRNLALLPD
jgi:hypothetical protein